MWLSKPDIIIVDDDEDDLALITEALQIRTPKSIIRCFPDAEQAYSFLNEEAIENLPHIVLTDFKLPGMSGSELVQKLSATARFQRMSKIIWSTSPNKSAMEQCLKKGADYYFIKPGETAGLDYISDALTTRLKFHLGALRHQQSLR